MTIKEAAAAWGITERRVNALCKAGRISGAYKAVSYTHLDVYKRQPLSCFSFRPRKFFRKEAKFALTPLGGTRTQLLLERRTQGVLAALGAGLFEELRRAITGGVLLHLSELPLIERFNHTMDLSLIHI